MNNTFTLKPVPPFRLDYTVWALRRRAKNIIDQWDGKHYKRLFVIENQPLLVTARQNKSISHPKIVITLNKSVNHTEKTKITDLLKTMLGIEYNLNNFYSLAEKDSLLHPIVSEFKGVKPPRFPSIFESLCNAIACQLLSLESGLQLLNNFSESYGKSVRYKEEVFYAFPEPADIIKCKPADLRKLGFSMTKSATIIEIAKIITKYGLSTEQLANMSDKEIITYLTSLKGIGRWSAEYILLRGLGRIHWLPGDDIGVQRNLKNFFHLRGEINYERVFMLKKRWDPYAGLVYFHLLLKKLVEKEIIF